MNIAIFYVVFFVTMLFTLPKAASASEIILKSGQKIEGQIVEENNNYIKIDPGVGVILTYYIDEIETTVPDNNQRSLDSATIDIPLYPLMELDGRTREDILNLRVMHLNQIPKLLPKNYQPSMEVFGQLEDRKPWWGQIGISYYGPGEKSISGPSRESQFIVNPYLLVGIVELNAHIVSNRGLPPKEIYPRPIKLVWEKNRHWGQIIYNISDYYKEAIQYRYPDPKEQMLDVINARDFGFNFLSIDSSQSKNITGTKDQIIPIIQYIHTGGSCGYAGGCNNRSPTQQELFIQWSQLPARIYIKLWKNQVNDPQQKSDMDFIIDLK